MKCEGNYYYRSLAGMFLAVITGELKGLYSDDGCPIKSALSRQQRSDWNFLLAETAGRLF